MLVADRRELQASVRQRTLQIQQEELQVFVDNLNVLGTQAAFLASLGWTSVSQEYDTYNHLVKALLYVSGTAATATHLMCSFICAITSIHGPALAVRGPEGSIDRSLTGMYRETRLCKRLFGAGVFLILIHGVFVVHGNVEVESEARQHAHVPDCTRRRSAPSASYSPTVVRRSSRSCKQTHGTSMHMCVSTCVSHRACRVRSTCSSAPSYRT